MMLLSLSVNAKLIVNTGSFKELTGFSIVNHEKTDVNDVPYAVIKIRTQNIDDVQCRRLTFGVDMSVNTDVEFKMGEVWLYLTYHADYVKISHPDFSSTEFHFPFDLKPECGYELTLTNKSKKGVVLERVKHQIGRDIRISTGRSGDKLYADGNFIGVSPLTATLSFGEHLLKAERVSNDLNDLKVTKDTKVAQKNITISQGSGLLEVKLTFKQEINGHEYVDLGLPSGTLWATCNVGTRPQARS